MPDRLVIDSLPPGVNLTGLMEELGPLVEQRKVPQLLAAANETGKDDGLRVTLTLKSPADADAVMSYLFRHTSLEQNYSFNLTALVPERAVGRSKLG